MSSAPILRLQLYVIQQRECFLAAVICAHAPQLRTAIGTKTVAILERNPVSEPYRNSLMQDIPCEQL
jgi:hypothetical protein